MLNLSEVLVFLVIAAGVVVVNIIIFKYSKLSPCYIEFDNRRTSEMEMMNNYNETFNSIFVMYGTLSAIIGALLLLSMNPLVAMVLMILQMVYTVVSFLVMIWMYVRSVIYWSRFHCIKKNSIA